ncbi:MAG TPA: hypothetical protein P5102_11455 [Candidatus Competibacteraceae bacterium]|nr:hypothetical protein [Candidatus Competibacteraceae bacterium]
MVELHLQSARLQPPVNHPPFHTWTFRDGTLWTEFHRTNGGYLLRFPNLADFQVSADGLHVTGFPAPEVSKATSQHLYLNQVLPLVLSKLGKLVFHASAVEIGGGAVAFVAESGRGKSTLAASFAVNGFRFLTDDGLVVEPGVDGFAALPSHPSIRLWEDSEDALVPPTARRAPPVQYTAKARFLADEDLAFCDQPRPLQRVYFLGDGRTATLELHRLTPAEAVIEWVKHSFLLDIEEKPRLASHFDQVAKLANQPIHYRLDYPRRFEDLAHVREAIVEHARHEYVWKFAGMGVLTDSSHI